MDIYPYDIHVFFLKNHDAYGIMATRLDRPNEPLIHR